LCECVCVSQDNWSTEDYDDCPVVRLAGPGAPVRTPGGEPKRVAKDGVEPEGDLWAVKVAPNKKLTFLFKFRPQVRSCVKCRAKPFSRHSASLPRLTCRM